VSRTRRLAVLLAWGAAGCALTSKGQAVEVRWYTLEVPRAEAANHLPAGPALRLDNVQSSPALGERIAWGDGRYQIGFYEERRWMERPARFVTSALQRALFRARGLRPTTEAAAPRVDVELVSFQEIRSDRVHAARVALHLQLLAECAHVDATVVRDEPVIGSRFDDFVSAISRAVGVAANEAAERVEAALPAHTVGQAAEGLSCPLESTSPSGWSGRDESSR